MNNTTPALSAANLNKLTNELEAQAVEIGLADQPPPLAVLDNFNRANENPLSQSGAWTTIAGSTPLKIVSNQMLASAAWSASYRGSYTNVEGTVKLGTIAASSNDFEIWLRLKDAGAVSPIRDSNKSCYSFYFNGKASYAIYNFTNGVNTATLKAITAWAGGALADGDTVGCRAVGTTLEVWVKRGAGAWTKEFTMTSSAHTAAGAVGFVSESLTSTFDDFGGGEVAPGHTLPNWADGVAPALTDAAPLNEMERILDLVAADQGLSYTPTVWAAGWSPPRNAINLNKMETQAEANRNAIDTVPGGSYQNPIGAIRYAGSFETISQNSRYRYYIISSSDAVPASAAPGLALPYVNGTTIDSAYWTGVDYATANANGWLLHHPSTGAVLTHKSYPTKYLADVGDQNYRDEFFDQVMARAGYVEGVFIDDTLGTLIDLTSGGVYPAEYPNQTLWYAAMRDFILDVGGRLKAQGRYVVANALSRFNGINDGSTVKTWWQALAPGLSGICNESWMKAPDSTGPHGYLRWEAVDYRAYWSSWLGLVDTAQDAGCDFFGVSSMPTADTKAMRYMRASMLLEWDGGGGAFFFAWNNYDAQNDPYNINWAIDMGLPTAAKTSIGTGCWKRTYENGKILVNPTLTSQTIDGRVVPAVDAYLGV